MLRGLGKSEFQQFSPRPLHFQYFLDPGPVGSSLQGEIIRLLSSRTSFHRSRSWFLVPNVDILGSQRK